MVKGSQENIICVLSLDKHGEEKVAENRPV